MLLDVGGGVVLLSFVVVSSVLATAHVLILPFVSAFQVSVDVVVVVLECIVFMLLTLLTYFALLLVVFVVVVVGSGIDGIYSGCDVVGCVCVVRVFFVCLLCSLQ